MRLNLSPAAQRYVLFASDGPDDPNEPGIVIWAEPALSDVIQDVIADESLINFVGESEGMTNLDADGDAKITLEAMRSHGKFEILFTKAIARRVITRWEGVEDPDGSEAQVTPDRIDAFIDHSAIYHKFRKVYLDQFLTVQSEKKGSAPSQTGTSAAARPTAKPARKSAKPAREKPTSRKR